MAAKTEASPPRRASVTRAPSRIDLNEGAQGDLSGLIKALDKKPGEPQRVAVAPSDIGGELLALLSKGLYTNPLDSIREYVQNSVDAGAKAVTITVSGKSVQVFDNGD